MVFCNSRIGVVVNAECYQVKLLRSIPAWDMSTLRFFLERKKKDQLEEKSKIESFQH